MELKPALAKANQILDEEQIQPTVSYRDRRAEEPGMVGLTALMVGKSDAS
jgi:hypothetical protein